MKKLSRRHLIVLVVAWVAFSCLAYRAFFQFRGAPVFVGSMPPLPAQAQERLSRNEPANLPPSIRAALAGIPFGDAEKRFVSRADLVCIRGRLAWGTWSPYWVETLMVHDADRVTARVEDKRATWVELVRRDGSWRLERLVKPEPATISPR